LGHEDEDWIHGSGQGPVVGCFERGKRSIALMMQAKRYYETTRGNNAIFMLAAVGT
jgi:hypothetical protein